VILRNRYRAFTHGSDCPVGPDDRLDALLTGLAAALTAALLATLSTFSNLALVPGTAHQPWDVPGKRTPRPISVGSHRLGGVQNEQSEFTHACAFETCASKL
jgi:hypothetical protein